MRIRITWPGDRRPRDIRPLQAFSLLRLCQAWHSLLGVGALLALSAGGVLAQGISVLVNGQPVHFQGVGPLEVEGRVLVPVRGVLEQLGANVAWVPQTRSVVASNANVDIELKIGDRRATVNGRTVLLDVPAQVIENHTMVPLRFLSEALGAHVGWDGRTHTVTVDTTGQGNNPPPARPAPPAGNAPAPVIDSFTQDAGGWLHPGQVVHVTLVGTPGGQASFRIPGLANETPMRETSPGHYTGVWQVPTGKAIQLSDAAVIGSLRIGNKTAPLIQAAGTISVDAVPPRIRDLAPEPNTRVTTPRPNIYAVFEDQGSGLNQNAVRLRLNQRDVTPEATVTRDFVSYTPPSPLSAGPQLVELTAADRAGNKVATQWTFIEESSAAQGIKAVTSNATRPLEPGDTLHVEMQGMPGGKAFFSVGNIKNVPMQEIQPGHYAADYTIRKGEDTSNGVLITTLSAPNGQKYTAQATRAVVISTGKPMQPVITYPGPNDRPTNPLVVKGKATPNTQVRVRVDYQNKLLGVLAVRGTAADEVVNVDKNGNWQTQPIDLAGLFSTRNMQYTITVTDVNAVGQQSAASTRQFRLR